MFNYDIPMIALVLALVLLSAPLSMAAEQPPCMWLPEDPGHPDVYGAFRGRIELDQPAELTVHTLGASWFVGWLDGAFFCEGPARYPADHPQYQVFTRKLDAGEHLLAFQVHDVGAVTRMLPDIDPYLYCRVFVGGRELPVQWKCARLMGYRPMVRRINVILSWVEWCDTRQNPENWQQLDFDDRDWKTPATVHPHIGEIGPVEIAPVQHFMHELEPMAEGPLSSWFGYETDDPPTRFFLRPMDAAEVPPLGVWRRYDLGRIRLGRPHFVLDLPAGAVVEFAVSEYLRKGRVMPWINVSTSPSANMDHYVARGGRQAFFPLTPKGGRFLEVHVITDKPGQVEFVEEGYQERCYFDRPIGNFQCDDELLNRIWHVGVETLRACVEDTVIDNPTRERGQWTGDGATVGLEIAGMAYSDLRLFRRLLIMDAQCARADGMVAGLCPGTVDWLPPFAAQWQVACVRYYQFTGDKELLEALYPAAVKNLSAFHKYVNEAGLMDGAGWTFIDWGYERNEGPADMAYNLHYLGALNAMQQWCRLLDKQGDLPIFIERADHIRGVVGRWLADCLEDDAKGWPEVGYHSAVLSLRWGLVPDEKVADCIAYIKRHILNCFPNNPDAPRLAHPYITSRQIITPYFAHFAFESLIEHGEIDFVMDQYHRCWGWLLQDGRTTWLEVFDPRWSHCHHWSGPPTWQMSRYLLGLNPRFDRGKNHFDFVLTTGSLKQARGSVPLRSGKQVHIEWRQTDEGVSYTITSPEEITLHMPEELYEAGFGREIVIREGMLELSLPSR